MLKRLIRKLLFNNVINKLFQHDWRKVGDKVLVLELVGPSPLEDHSDGEPELVWPGYWAVRSADEALRNQWAVQEPQDSCDPSSTVNDVVVDPIRSGSGFLANIKILEIWTFQIKIQSFEFNHRRLKKKKTTSDLL